MLPSRHQTQSVGTLKGGEGGGGGSPLGPRSGGVGGEEEVHLARGLAR